jgi:DNA gyrase subunit A
MMTEPQRPDLSQVGPEVRAYIDELEAELESLRRAGPSRRQEAMGSPPEPSEPPTSRNVITISAAGMAKRTPRHHYERQRRGGMGIFDLECDERDFPQFLLIADQEEGLLCFTDRGRVFRLAVAELPETPVRGRGEPLSRWLALQAEEQLAVIVPDRGGSQLYLLTQRGWVRRFSSNIFVNLRPGLMLYEMQGEDVPTAACWASGRDDLFVVTRQGQAIRFGERQVPARGGCLGVRLDREDQAIALVPVQEESSVFLLGNDGRGTVRLMSGFRANKAPGAGGKVAMKTDVLVGAVPVAEGSDLFAISRLSKIIRFVAAEVPAKEGVVQGVNCMSLRSDEVTALCSTTSLS